MSIETDIQELTAALKENTLALRDVLAASTTIVQWDAREAAPAPKEEPKPAKKAKKVKKEAAPEPDPEPEPTPEPEVPVEEQPAAEDEPEAGEPTAAELVKRITDTVLAAIVAPGGKPQEKKDAWRAVCAEFGVELISKLDDVEKLKEALAKAEAL